MKRKWQITTRKALFATNLKLLQQKEVIVAIGTSYEFRVTFVEIAI